MKGPSSIVLYGILLLVSAWTKKDIRKLDSFIYVCFVPICHFLKFIKLKIVTVTFGFSL